jgi:hypothetical protein
MDDRDILILRHMLRILIDLGPTGLEEPALAEQAEIAAGVPLTTAEKALAVRTAADRQWIACFRNPITNRVRWYATEQGKIAYAGL